MPALLDNYPIRVLVNGEDFGQVVDDGLSWSNADPGGFEACSIPIGRDCPELLVGMPIRIESGLSTAWEGRISEIQRSLGDKTIVTGEGYGAILKENYYSMVYVDQDLSRWQQASIAEQKQMVSNFIQMGSFQVGPDPKNESPALVLTVTGRWAAPWEPQSEAWYDSGPNNLVSQLYYNISFPSVAGTEANWIYRVHICSDDTATIDQTPVANQYNNGVSSNGYFAPATSYRYAFCRWKYTATPAGAEGRAYNAFNGPLAVYGNHGLTGRGSDPQGFYPSDIVKHAVSQTPNGAITAGLIPDYTSLIVPHYVQYVPVAIEQVIADMGGVAGVHWGVWESLAPVTGSTGPRLDFVSYPSQATCYAFRRECDTLDVNEQLSGLYNKAWVTYTSTSGVQRATFVALDNPFLNAVNTNRTLDIDIGTATSTVATSFGLLVLQLSQLQARVAGQATLSGLVNTVGGGQKAPWLLRSGQDRFRVPDLPGQNAYGTTNDFLITRVESSVTSSGLSTNLELGTGPNLIEVLQSRLQIVSPLTQVG